MLPLPWWWAVGTRYARLQLAGIGLALLLALAILQPIASPLGALLVALATTVHFVKMHPYVWPPFGSSWVREDAPPAELRILSLNVLKENPERDRVAKMLRDSNADVILLMEIDEEWIRDLDPAAMGYEHTLVEPRDDHYGLAFLSKRPFHDAEIRHAGMPGRPLGRITVDLGETEVIVVGLHPEPPVPGTDADAKDRYLFEAAELVGEQTGPVVVLGDLNDVAWSPTTRLFVNRSGLLDPRIGRGLFPTFYAGTRLMSWPIDHIFHTAEVACDRLEVLDDVGSDHYPILAEFRHAGPHALEVLDHGDVPHRPPEADPAPSQVPERPRPKVASSI